ncbi:MAG TPA: S8 family serine peptidase [Candidatus Methylomirabilis sp.]|nr:S8 family serine peptidase [Candidatus Methylomirabilis sp.]
MGRSPRGRRRYRGNYFYRDGQKFPLTKLPDAFALRLREGRLPAELRAWTRAGERLPPVALDRAYGRKRLATYRVRGAAAARDRAMDALRRDGRTQYCTHVYRRRRARAPDPLILTDEIVVQFKPDLTGRRLRSLCRERGIVLDEPIPGLENGYLCRVTRAAGENALKVANRLYEEGVALAAEPNFLRRLARRGGGGRRSRGGRVVPNDPLFPKQWHLHNTGQGGARAGADVKALAAWEVTKGSPRVTIAVIDDGFDLGHPDLRGRGKIVAPYDFGEDDPDPSPALEDAHGTACAGVATAVGGDGVGVIGIAPRCRLMPIRLSLEGLDEAAIARAFRWAAGHGAAVISNSWGPPDGTGVKEPLPLIVRAAMDQAVGKGRGGRGCVICFAAGNGDESADLCGYANYPKVIAVAATTDQDRRAWYSDFGKAISVAAPSSGGRNGIWTTDVRGRRGYNPEGDWTGEFGGTSAACPLVAGVAALVLSVNPSLTAAEVRQVLEATADKVDPGWGRYDARGHSRYYGYGRVNAGRAVREAQARRRRPA